MALYTIPKRRTTAQNVSQIVARALAGIIAGRQQKRRGELEERGMGLEEAIAQAKMQGTTATLQDFMSQAGGGYEKPTVSVGPRGRVRGATYRPKKAGYPQTYQVDLKNAIAAINRGADRYKVYSRIAGTYPQYSTELKRILLFTPASKRLEALREALFGGE